MANESPKIWARVDPDIRERVRTEAGRLYDGNESMLVRRAVVQFLDDLDKQRRLESVVSSFIEEIEREAIPA